MQWDRTLQWFIDTEAVATVTNSTAYGNYKDHDIASYTELNSGARYTTSGTTEFIDVTSNYSKGSDSTDVGHILTTGH